MKLIDIIKNVACSSMDADQKNEILDEIASEIQIGRDIANGKYKWCSDCNDYYLTKSFFTENETKEEKECVYEDAVNSDKNEYINYVIDAVYEICPKEHKRLIHYKKKRK